MSDDEGDTKNATRDGADRLCLWRLCGRLTCGRARACRGDPRDCTATLRLWLGALAARPDMALEAAPLVLTKEETRQLALFRSAVEQAEVKPVSVEDEAAADRLRMDLARRLHALSEQMQQEQDSQP